MRKIAVLFPGIGYTCDRPLLYYAGKLAASLGCEVVRVQYGGFPEGVKGNAEKMRQAFWSALEQTESSLSAMDWQPWDSVIFIGKSVGTLVAGAYAENHHIPAKTVLLTPIVETFDHISGPAIAFHGTADPWARTADVKQRCEGRIPLYLTEGANHSLETGDVEKDIETLRETMRLIRAFITGEESSSPRQHAR